MSKVTPRPHAELIKAWADGATIQVLHATGIWVDSVHPAWCSDSQYRIKPATQKYRVALLDNGYSRYTMTVNTEEQSKAFSYMQNNFFVRWLTDWVEYDV